MDLTHTELEPDAQKLICARRQQRSMLAAQTPVSMSGCMVSGDAIVYPLERKRGMLNSGAKKEGNTSLGAVRTKLLQGNGVPVGKVQIRLLPVREVGSF
jgi:hypothetical protein